MEERRGEWAEKPETINYMPGIPLDVDTYTLHELNLTRAWCSSSVAKTDVPKLSTSVYSGNCRMTKTRVYRRQTLDNVLRNSAEYALLIANKFLRLRVDEATLYAPSVQYQLLR